MSTGRSGLQSIKIILPTIFYLLLLKLIWAGDYRYHAESRLYEQDDLYRYLEELYISSGDLMPAQDFLLTWGDAKESFELWREKHPRPGPAQQKVIDRIEDLLANLGEQGQIRLMMGAEVLRHTVPDCTVSDPFYRFFRDKDFNIKYADRERFADLEILLPLHRTVFISNRTSLRNDWKYFNSRPVDFPRNLREINLDVNERSLLQFHQGHFRLIFGRDRLSLGVGKSGKLLIGDQNPQTTHLQFQYRYKDVISYNQFVASMKNAVAPEENPKILYAYRLTYRFLNRFSIAISEQLMTNRSLNATYLVPFMVYHNIYAYPEQRNVMTALDFEAVPVSGLKAYGSWVVDEMDSKALEENGDRGREAWGLLLGIQWAQPFAQSGLSVNSEYIKLTEWFYNHGNPYYDFYSLNMVYEERRGLTDPDIFHRFIGYPLGSNADALINSFRWHQLELYCDYIQQGEIPIFSRSFSRPVLPTKEYRWNLGVKYRQWLWNDRIDLNTALYYSSVRNFHQNPGLNIDFWEFWLSLKVKLCDFQWDMTGIL